MLASSGRQNFERRISSVLHTPVVGNAVVERIQTLDLVGIVGNARTISDYGGFRPHSLEPVPYQWGDDHQLVIVGSEKDFVDLAFAEATSAIIKQHQFDLADRNRVIEHHLPVDLPGFDRAGMHGREVDFAEALEMRSIGAQHVHDLAALIQDLAQWDGLHALDHLAEVSRIYAAIWRRDTSRGSAPS